MVKIESTQRLKDLEGMVLKARIELEYRKLKSRQLKGNKELFGF